MKCFKYIIFEKSEGIEVPLIFSKLLTHDTVASGRKYTSAGFIRFAHGHIECYGESVSLSLKSRGETDLQIILDDYNFHV